MEKPEQPVFRRLHGIRKPVISFLRKNQQEIHRVGKLPIVGSTNRQSSKKEKNTIYCIFMLTIYKTYGIIAVIFGGGVAA